MHDTAVYRLDDCQQTFGFLLHVLDKLRIKLLGVLHGLHEGGLTVSDDLVHTGNTFFPCRQPSELVGIIRCDLGLVSKTGQQTHTTFE